MRLPLMTTRRWMIVVAIIGLITGGTIEGMRLKRRHDYAFLSRLEYYARKEDEAVGWERTYRKLVEREERAGSRCDDLRRHLDQISQGVEYYSALARKYRRAAHYPWLPVEPDPPEPDWMPPIIRYGLAHSAANDGNGET
jgi:hypothetical protein